MNYLDIYMYIYILHILSIWNYMLFKMKVKHIYTHVYVYVMLIVGWIDRGMITR